MQNKQNQDNTSEDAVVEFNKIFGEAPLPTMIIKETVVITSLSSFRELSKIELMYRNEISKYFTALGFKPFALVTRKKITGSGGYYVGIVFESKSNALLKLIENTNFKELLTIKKRLVIHFLKIVSYIPLVKVPQADSIGIKKELCERACFLSPSEKKNTFC